MGWQMTVTRREVQIAPYLYLSWLWSSPFENSVGMHTRVALQIISPQQKHGSVRTIRLFSTVRPSRQPSMVPMLMKTDNRSLREAETADQPLMQPQAKLIIKEDSPKMISSFWTVVGSLPMVTQQPDTMFCRPIARDKQYFRICDSTLYSTLVQLLGLLCGGGCGVRPVVISSSFLRWSASSSDSMPSKQSSRCTRTATVMEAMASQKAMGKFCSSSCSVCWAVAPVGSLQTVSLQWVSGRQISRAQNRNIVAEKGSRMSLSPMRMLVCPNRDDRAFSTLQARSAAPQTTFSIYTRIIILISMGQWRKTRICLLFLRWDCFERLLSYAAYKNRHIQIFRKHS